ncbi:MAG: hypothetical protein ABL921_31495, partial [Pirellula sp.]
MKPTWIAALALTAACGGSKDPNGGSTGGGGGGNSSSTGIGAAVSLALIKNNTQAFLGSQASTTEITGNAFVRAIHKHNLDGMADGNADGGDTGIGISFGLNQIDDDVIVEVKRDLIVGGNVTIEALALVDSDLETKASANGTSNSSNNPDQEAQAQRNPNASSNPGASSNTGSQSALPSSTSSETTQANSSTQSQSNSQSQGLGVAASVGFNIFQVTNTTTIANNVDIVATGTVSISANGHFDAETKATGTAVSTEESDGVAAGVGFSYADVDNLASVGNNATIKGTNVTLEALTKSPGSETEINEFLVWGAAAAGGTGDFAFAGSVALNIVDLTYMATSGAGSSLKATTDNLTVRAEIDMNPQTLAAGAGFATQNDSTVVGGSVAFAEVDLNATASIGGNADASKAMVVNAETTIKPTVTNVPELDIDIDFNTVAVMGSASGGDDGYAGAVAVDDYSITTHAFIAPNAQINQAADVLDSASQSVSVTADSDVDVTSVAGSLGVSAKGTGVGAGLQLGIINKDTKAYVGNGANVSSKGGVMVDSGSTEKLISVSANAGVGKSTGLAGSVSVYVMSTNTGAYVDNNADVVATGNIDIKANGSFALTGVAGAIGVGGDTGIGAANTTIVHHDTVQAWVGTSALIDTDGVLGLNVQATSNEDIIGISAAGGASGSDAFAGSATVLVLDEFTKAFVNPNVTLNAHNGPQVGAPNVALKAIGTTTIVTVAGNLAASGSNAVGVGADVSKLNKETSAYIASNAIATVEGDIYVLADSAEDFTCVAAGLAASGSAAVVVDAAITILDIDTRAFIGDDPSDILPSLGPGNVHATGSIIVDANDSTQLDKVIGVLGVGGSVGGAAGVGVSSINKRTEAFIGKDAVVAADGQGGSANVKNGLFAITYSPSPTNTTGVNASGPGSADATSNVNTLRDQGEVGAPGVGEMKPHNDADNVATDPSNSAQRTLSPAVRSGFKGLSVTATNKDDIEVYTVALAFGSVGVAISSGISVVENETLAYISEGAVINSNQ